MKTRIVVLCLVLIGASAFISRASRPEVVPIRESLSGLPMRIGTWTGREAPDINSRVMAVLGVDDYVNRIYYSTDLFPASLYVGYYQSQRQGDTIHSPLNCLPGAGWNPVKRGHIKIAVDGNSAIEINRIIILKGTDKQVVLYWYQNHGRAIASEYWGKIYTVLDALRTNRTDAALVRVICPVSGDDADSDAFAERQAVDFVKSLFPLLSRFLPV
jgi:EpsI family protein